MRRNRVHRGEEETFISIDNITFVGQCIRTNQFLEGLNLIGCEKVGDGGRELEVAADDFFGSASNKVFDHGGALSVNKDKPKLDDDVAVEGG